MIEAQDKPAASETKAVAKEESQGFVKKMVKSVRKYLPRHAKTDVEKAYKMGKDLGTGNFAVVKLAIKRDTNEKFAIKIINKALCAGKEDMIETEIAVLKKVKHKYIVGMLEEFDTPDKLYLVLDLVTGGELFDRIVDEVIANTRNDLTYQGNFTEVDASRITRQMTEAIQYLHEHGIVHRDLKPENLLFRDRTPQADILVTDFGLAKLVALKTACGTPNYVAPEILFQRGYGKQVDVWSLGVILFILLCGYPPFYDERDAVLFELIMKGKFDFDERYWKDISQDARNTVSNMLQVDPVKRYDTYQVLAHPWVSGKAQISSINLSKSVSMNLKKHMGVDGAKGSKAACTLDPAVEETAAAAPDAVAAAPAQARVKKTAV